MTTRRGFLQGFAATLAAAAVLPTGELLAANDHVKLMLTLRNGGIVENMHFVFYEGETIELGDLPNVLIRNCTFVRRGKPGSFFTVSRRGSGSARIEDCTFIADAYAVARPNGEYWTERDWPEAA